MTVLLTFTAAYVVALTVYGFVVDSPLALLYTGITLGLFVLFFGIHRWARWPLSALWAVSLVGLGNMLGGVLIVGGAPLYVADISPLPPYDKIFHTLAALAMFLVAWEALRRWAGRDPHHPGLLLSTWLVTMGGGAVVEIVEYVGTLTADVNVGDYANNALDIVANGLGALLGLLVTRVRERRKRLLG